MIRALSRIRIQLSPADPDVPELRLLRGCRELELLLDELDIGDVLPGATNELWLLCDDPEEALPLVEQAIAELELEQDASIEIV